jgi:hypothetical protein
LELQLNESETESIDESGTVSQEKTMKSSAIGWRKMINQSIDRRESVRITTE